jgi:hypothetical protein
MNRINTFFDWLDALTEKWMRKLCPSASYWQQKAECKHILVPGEACCLRCGESIVSPGPETAAKPRLSW